MPSAAACAGVQRRLSIELRNQPGQQCGCASRDEKRGPASVRHDPTVGSKETQHFARGVGALAVGIGAALAAAGPGVACAVHDPVLSHHMTVVISVGVAGSGPPVGVVKALGEGRRAIGRGTRHTLAVDRVHSAILVAMENDGRRAGKIAPLAALKYLYMET